MSENESKWTWTQYRTLIILSLCNFLSSTVYSIQSPFYPPEAEKKNVTSSEYGVVFGIYELVVFCSCPFVPLVTNYFGHYITFHLGLYTVVTSVVIFGFLDRINNRTIFVILSIILRMFEGVGSSLILTTNYSFGTNLFPESVATVLAILETMFAFGQSAGPPIGGFFYGLGGFTLPFVVLGCMLGSLSICTLPGLPNFKSHSDSVEPQQTNSTPTNVGFGFLSLLKIPIVQIYAFNLMSTGISIGFLIATLEPHIRQFDLSPVSTGAMYLIYGGVYAISSIPWGWVCDHISNAKYIPIIGTALILIGFIFIGPIPFLGISTSISLVAGSLVLIGLGLGAIYVSGFLLIHNGAKHSKDSENNNRYVSSLWLSSVTFGLFLGPIIGCSLYQQFGFQYETLFVVGLFVLNLCILIIGTFWNKPNREKEAYTRKVRCSFDSPKEDKYYEPLIPSLNTRGSTTTRFYKSI